jgi:hypothetical protein
MIDRDAARIADSKRSSGPAAAAEWSGLSRSAAEWMASAQRQLLVSPPAPPATVTCTPLRTVKCCVTDRAAVICYLALLRPAASRPIELLHLLLPDHAVGSNSAARLPRCLIRTAPALDHDCALDSLHALLLQLTLLPFLPSCTLRIGALLGSIRGLLPFPPIYTPQIQSRCAFWNCSTGCRAACCNLGKLRNLSAA